MEGALGDASTEGAAAADGAGVERGCIAGEGGGGIEFALGVERAGGGVGAARGVEAVFINAFGFTKYSRNFLGLI